MPTQALPLEIPVTEDHPDDKFEDEDSLHIDKSTFVNFDDDPSQFSKEREEMLSKNY